MKNKKIISVLMCTLFGFSCFSGYSAKAMSQPVKTDNVIKQLQDQIKLQQVQLKQFEETKPYPGKQIDVVFVNQGMKVAATVTYPKDLSKKCPAVLLLPGYLGERDELPVTNSSVPTEGGRPEGFWQRTAEKLADAGYVSLRIDYRGSGKSEGLWQDCTASGQLSDGKVALKYLSQNPAVDKTRIAVSGISEGGAFAACMSNEPNVKAVVLWSAAPDFKWVGEQVPKDKMDEYNKNGKVTLAMPWGEEMVITKDYVDSASTLDPLKEISKFKGALLSVCGLHDEDVTPQPQQAQKFLDAHDGKEDLVKIDADHIYNCFTGTEKVDEAINATIKWLNENL